MEIIDIICWVILAIIIGLTFWSLCVTAGDSDDRQEEYWREYWSKEEEENEQ